MHLRPNRLIATSKRKRARVRARLPVRNDLGGLGASGVTGGDTREIVPKQQ
jgi:hypothetical protein